MFADASPTRGPSLTTARPAETRQVFEEALAHTGPGRSAFLRRRCAHDAALLEEVGSLLEADAHASQTGLIEEVIEAAVRELRSRNRAR